MSKVLVLYYSTYGHIETMAQAVAEGARAAGAKVDVKRVPETAPPEIAKAGHFKLDQAAPVANVADLEGYGRLPDALWPHALADGKLSGPGRRSVGARRTERQGGRRIHFDRHPTWRARSHAVFCHHQPVALWHDHCRSPVQPSGPNDAGRDRGWQPVRRDHHRGWSRSTSAQRDRVGGRAPPRQADRPNRQ